MNTCYIVGAGAFTARDFNVDDGDLLIAADGGYRSLLSIGVVPHILLGDFDSLGGVPADLPPSVNVVYYPVEKDDTDTGIALEAGYSRGYRRFALYGCGGGRLDHLFANMQSMCRYRKKGASIKLVDGSYDIYALYNETLALPPRPLGTLVSVFCNGDRAEGVTLRGLQYPLNEATLTCDYPLGVSNHYASEHATVSIQNGSLLVMVFTCAKG